MSLNETNIIKSSKIKPKFLAYKSLYTKLSKPDNCDNIFEAEKTNNLDYTDKFFGPRFDQSGSLIKYSIIGNPDKFLRMYQRDSNSPKKSNSPIHSTYTNLGFESRTNIFTRKRTMTNTIVGAQAISKPNANFIKLTRGQISREIDKISKRINKNKENDEELKNSLTKNEKRFFSKDEEINKKCQEKEKIWNNEVNKIKQKVRRSKSNYLMMASSDEFRLRKEWNDILESLKTDQEKFGKKLWEISLRKQMENENKKNYNQNIVNLFKKSQMTLFTNHFEMIRKGDLINKNNENKRNSFLYNRIKENQEKIKIIRPEEENFNGFLVKGENQLDREIKFFQRECSKSQIFLKEKIDENKKEQPEEIIESSYHIPDLMKNTGSAIFPKITSVFSSFG